MDVHPSSDELVAFLTAKNSNAVRRFEIVRHLLSGCPSCRNELGRLRHQRGLRAILRDQLGSYRETPHLSPDFDYSRAFAAAERTLELFVTDDGPVTSPPGRVLGELGLLPGAQTERLPLTPERRAIPFLVRWLVEKSFACRYESPAEMLQWALMSRIAAEDCSAEIAGSASKVADLRPRAEAQLANSLRVLGRSDEAQAELSSAWEYLSKGTGDLELRAYILEKAASLSILQDHLDAAFDCLGEASKILNGLGMTHHLAKVDVVQALACHAAGDSERQAYLLERALVSIDPDEDAYLPFLVRNNLVHSYVESGREKLALAALLEARAVGGDRQRQDALWSRFLWNEGRLLVLLGMPEPAKSMLARARAGFWRHELLHELVMVTQDLVHVQRDLGEVESAQRSIAATSARVNSRRSGPEVLQALVELQSTAA